MGLFKRKKPKVFVSSLPCPVCGTPKVVENGLKSCWCGTSPVKPEELLLDNYIEAERNPLMVKK